MPNPAGEQIHVRDEFITSRARAFVRVCAVVCDGALANQLNPDADDDDALDSARLTDGVASRASAVKDAIRRHLCIGPSPQEPNAALGDPVSRPPKSV